MERGDLYALERRNPNRRFFLTGGNTVYPGFDVRHQEEYQVGTPPGRRPSTARASRFTWSGGFRLHTFPSSSNKPR